MQELPPRRARQAPVRRLLGAVHIAAMIVFDVVIGLCGVALAYHLIKAFH